MKKERIIELRREIEKKHPVFKNEWDILVQKLGADFVSKIRRGIREEFMMIKEVSQFRFKIVIDNNFLFSQIKGVVDNNSDIKRTFLYKFVSSSFVDVFGPHLLRTEIFAKIEAKMNPNVHELAKQHAETLLGMITIEDAKWAYDWSKAKKLIGEKDSDDIPYLALAFDISAHGVISEDKVFKEQNDAKSWSFNEAKNIMTVYNSGFISFTLFGAGLCLIKELVLVVMKIIVDFVMTLIKIVKTVVNGTFNLLVKKSSKEILFLIGVALGVALLNKKIKNVSKDVLVSLKTKCILIIKKTISILRLFKEVWQEAKKIVEPAGILSADVMYYLMLEFELMKCEVENMENTRAK